MFQINVVEKIKIHILCSTIFFRKSCLFLDNVEQSGRARDGSWYYSGALHAELVRLHARKHSPASMHTYPHARARTHTHTHTDIRNILLFHGNSVFIDTPQYYVLRSLPPLLISCTRSAHPNPFFLLEFTSFIASERYKLQKPNQCEGSTFLRVTLYASVSPSFISPHYMLKLFSPRWQTSIPELIVWD